MKSPSIRFGSLYAGALYFVIVFAIGFALGTLRYLIVVPRIGELAAVLVEIPVILSLAWLVAGWVIKRLRVPNAMRPRLAMSISALVLLLVAEFALSIWIFGNSVGAHFDLWSTPHGALGLVGQLAFAMFPVIRLWVGRD